MAHPTPIQFPYTILDGDERIALHLPSQHVLDLLQTEHDLEAAAPELETLQMHQQRTKTTANTKNLGGVLGEYTAESIENQIVQIEKQIRSLKLKAQRQLSAIQRRGAHHHHHHGSSGGGIAKPDNESISSQHRMPIMLQVRSEVKYWEKGGDGERQAIHSAKTVLNDMGVLTAEGQMRMHRGESLSDGPLTAAGQTDKEHTVAALVQEGGPEMEAALADGDPSSVHDTVEPSTHNCSLYIALDISESMDKEGIETALVGIDRFLHQFMPLFRTCKLFPFRDGCSPRPLHPETFSRTIRSVTASGLTSFVNVLNSITNSIMHEDDPSRDIVVWWLSDGYFTDSEHDLYSCTDRLKQTFANMSSQRSITFHTVGFIEPLVEPLVLISNLGNRRGTFQHAATMALFASQTTDFMCDIVDTTIQQNRASVKPYAISYVTAGTKGRREKIRLTDEITVVALTDPLRQILVPTVSESKLKRTSVVPSSVSLMISDTVFFRHKVEFVHIDDPYVHLMCQLDHIEGQLMSLIDRLVFTERKSFLHPIKIDRAESDIAALDQQITNCSMDKRFASLSGESKATVGDIIDFTKELVSNAYQILRRGTKRYKGASDGHSIFSSVRSEQSSLARLLSDCYAGMTRRRLAKKLSKRVLQNRHFLDQDEITVQQLRRSIRVDNSIEKSTPQLSRSFFTCSFSLSDWIECAQRGSALCLAINMSRAQAAIADPSQIKIHDIATTFISVDEFLRSAAYAMRENDRHHLHGRKESVHGGFSRARAPRGSVVKGMAREDINGVIPLFIHPDHWKIARIASRPALGWMITTDVFGYHPQQSIQLPLMGLFKFMDLGPDTVASEFHGRAFFQVVRTCMQIFSEHDSKLPDYEQPGNRLHDTVPSTRILLAKILLDPSRCDIRRRVLQILEEEIRRSLRAKYRSDENNLVARLTRQLRCDNLITINTSAAPDPADLHLMPIECRYLPHGYCHSNARSLESMINRRISKSMRVLCRFAQLYAIFDDVQMDALAAEMDINGGIAPDHLVRRYVKLMHTLQEKDKSAKPTTLDDLINTLNTISQNRQPTPGRSPISDPAPMSLSKEQINGLVVQCALHRRNSTRRQAIEKYGNSLPQPIFSQADAIRVLDQFVDECRKMQISRVVATCRTAYNLKHKLRHSLNPFCELFFRQRSTEEIEQLLSASNDGTYKGKPIDIDGVHCVVESPLVISLSNRRWDLIDVLLAHKASPSKDLFKGRNAFFYAVRAFRKAKGTMPAHPLLAMLEADPDCLFCVTNREQPLPSLLEELGQSEIVAQWMRDDSTSVVVPGRDDRIRIVEHIRKALTRYEQERIARKAAEEQLEREKLSARIAQTRTRRK